MALLYADENFPRPVVVELRRLGHDVLTCQEAGKAGIRVPDPDVLAAATDHGRAVLTINRSDFRRLHKQGGGRHAGIVVCTEDRDAVALARRIDDAIGSAPDLQGRLLSVVRPASGQ